MKLLLIGSTGLVGKEVLKIALDDPRFTQVTAMTRTALPAHPRLRNPVTDFSHLEENADWWQSMA